MSDFNDGTPLIINRREALLRVTALLGGASVVGSGRLLAALEKGVPGTPSAGTFTAQHIALLDEIAETILPATNTPGAKAAQTGAFMARMVTDCYSPAEQRVFRDGMSKVDEAARKTQGVSFMAATAAQRLAVLQTLDLEQKRIMDAREAQERRRDGLGPLPANANMKAPAHFPEQRKEASPEQTGREVEPDPHHPAHYFRMMKELTLLGYFTSEIGCTEAQRYAETPGRFDACVPYQAGQPSWAGHA
jgi:hypothetical protein